MKLVSILYACRHSSVDSEGADLRQDASSSNLLFLDSCFTPVKFESELLSTTVPLIDSISKTAKIAS
ncbi:hypothetical protein K2173_025080 [Erythroxylum novogranatense]|uniref:Uncharacterized protein n=1 Tax=Erythroxylum novogranatense TaxID=1862640 RepID=A0AAV8SVQ1_9ROSI|nr:hypothetical protein K2173_025080 [Erythroxylum novogranatense]